MLDKRLTELFERTVINSGINVGDRLRLKDANGRYCDPQIDDMLSLWLATTTYDTFEAPFPDLGPWRVASTDGRVAIQSDSFTHDVQLVVTGDFRTPSEKYAYGQQFAIALNKVINDPYRARQSDIQQCGNSVFKRIVSDLKPKDDQSIN